MEAEVIESYVLDNHNKAEVVEEDSFMPLRHREGSLRDVLSSEGRDFKPTVHNLIKLLKDEKILKNRNIRHFLFSESVIVAMFATLSGNSLINLELKDEYKPPITKMAVQAMRRQWELNDYIFGKFLLFILENSNVVFDGKYFNQPRYKYPLHFLTDNIVNGSALIIDQHYNLLCDYLKTIKHTILLNWVTVTMQDGEDDEYFLRIIKEYGKSFESKNAHRYYYCYYTLVDNSSKEKRLLESHKATIFDDKRINELINSGNSSASRSEDRKDSDDMKNFKGETVFSFDLNLDGSLVPEIMSNSSIRHEVLSKTLGLQKIDSPLLALQFQVLCGLVDPLTQPVPNDKHIISIDFLYQLSLGYMYSDIKKEIEEMDGLDWNFHLCFNMQKILKCTMIRLNFDDFEKLNSINNSDESVDWRGQLGKWIPHGFNTQNLELLYMVNILAVYAIYKSYSDRPIQLNPFLSSLIALWKNLTCVILLGLEIDRIEEEHETFDTPLLVRATIRGASALRAVVAAVLNGQTEFYKHDFQHESMNNFMSPFGRKLCQGALYADLKSFAGTMLALGSDLEDVTQLLGDLQPCDLFDEDVRYMFEYESDDFNDIQTKETNKKGARYNATAKDQVIRQRRCNCIFDDDVMEHEGDGDEVNEVEYEEIYEGGEVQPDISLLPAGKSQTARHPNSFEFDYSGKDWRDIPRGRNFYYTEGYDFLENPDLETIMSLTVRATNAILDDDERLLLLRSIASCVKNEQDGLVLGNLLNTTPDSSKTNVREENPREDMHPVQPDDIYDLWCVKSTFEKMLQRNPHLSWRLMDEMLVCSGFRRILIWFITHLKLNFPLIEYIYELVMGLRGNPPTDEIRIKGVSIVEGAKTRLPFSRQGPIELSHIETKMLMQEFFTNAAISLSDKSKETDSDHIDDDETEVSMYDVELIKLICSMVRTLILEERFDFSESESAFELQALLMNWLTIIPEARSLYFDLKAIVSTIKENSLDTDNFTSGDGAVVTSENQAHAYENSNDQKKVDIEYNEELMNLLPLPAKEHETNVENAIVETLRDSIKKTPFRAFIPRIGRKVIYADDKILPLPECDRTLDLHNYLLEFDEKYKNHCLTSDEFNQEDEE